MRNWDSPYLTDWFVISIRWLIMFGLAISLGIAARFDWFIVGFLTFAALWNGFVSVLATFNLRMGGHRLVNTVLDILVGVGLFYVSGSMGGPLFWIALMPIATAALYYELKGVLLATLLVTLAEAGMLYLNLGLANLQVPLVMLGGFNLISALLIGSVAVPFVEYLRKRYQEQVNARKEGERLAQQHERRRMQALFEMIETFSSTLNYQTVLETALDTGISAISAEDSDQTTGAVLLFAEQGLEIKTSRHFLQNDLHTQLPAERGALFDALKAGEPVLIKEPAKDPEIGQLSTFEEAPTAFCLPLIRGLNAYGVMLFGHPDPSFFNQERADILQMVSNQAVIALQNARLYQDLAKEKERIVQTQEEAQKKLARDLHDGPTQSVSAIAMRLNIARRLLEQSPEEAAPELARIEELARRTTDEIRHMLFTLRPLIMESEGLDAALQTLAERMKNLYQQDVTISLDPGAVDQMDSIRQTVIFALVEEAVNNARKHAKATKIWVKLKYAQNDGCIVILEVIDNGKGFNVNEVMGGYDRRGSLGMVNLRERSEQINGVLRIDSVPGKGTRIQVLIPTTDEAADRLHQSK